MSNLRLGRYLITDPPRLIHIATVVLLAAVALDALYMSQGYAPPFFHRLLPMLGGALAATSIAGLANQRVRKD